MRFEAVAAALLASALVCNCGNPPPPYQPWGSCYKCHYGTVRVGVFLEFRRNEYTLCANKTLPILPHPTPVTVLWYNVTGETPNLLSYIPAGVSVSELLNIRMQSRCDDGENMGFCPNDPVLAKDGATEVVFLHFCDDLNMPSLTRIPIPKILDAPLDSDGFRHIVVNVSLSKAD